MQERCHVCQSPHRLEIDRLLIQGVSKTSISERFSVSTQSLSNHMDRHLSHQLATAMSKKQSMESMNMLNEIETLYNRAKNILDKAEAKGKLNTAINAINSAKGVCELLLKMAVSLHEIRLLELEIEREKSGAAQKDREDVLEGKLSILTDAELDMLEKLRDKIINQTRGIIIEDEHKQEFPKTRGFVRTKKPEVEVVEDEPEQSEQGEEEEIVGPTLPKPRLIPPLPGEKKIRRW